MSGWIKEKKHTPKLKGRKMADKRKILVVDDEPAITVMISVFLNHLGRDYEMLRAFDKEKALELLKLHNPEVVLLDIDLHGINSGLQILNAINQDYKRTKTIIITGRAKDYKDQIHKIGCFYFFEKPVGGKELTDKIQEALGVRTVASDLPQEILTKTPYAKLLCVEPHPSLFAYLCSILDSAELSEGQYTVKVTADVASILKVMSEYNPDIVLISDCSMEDDHILEVIDIVNGVGNLKPKAVVVHGLFERDNDFEKALKEKGAYHCIQNVMDNEQILKMNKKLANCIAQICNKNGLVR